MFWKAFLPRDSIAILSIGIIVALVCHGDGRLGAEARDGSSPQLTKTLKSNANQVFIYDNVFGKKALSLMSNLAARYAPYDFTYPEKLEGFEDSDNGNLHWVANFSPEDFAKSQIWTTLVRRLPDVFKKGDFFPFEAQSILINRGDFPSVQKGNVQLEDLLFLFSMMVWN